MSKILVLDDKQFREVKSIYEETMRNSMVPQDMKITSFYHSIRCAFDDAEKKNRSVLEWHPAAEMLWKGYDILVRFDNGNVAPMRSDDFDFAVKLGAVEWAHMPK
jgi:hypothetical protein